MMQLIRPHAYTPIMKAIHWTTVIIVIMLLLIGWTMTSDLTMSTATRGMLFALHKSLGILILLLTLFRLYWGKIHRAPPLPAGLRPWEIMLVAVVHKLFYVLLLLQPLIGWMIYTVSTHKSLFFGLFRIPDLPFMITFQNFPPVLDFLEGIHAVGASILAIAIVLHVGAALKHHFVIRDDVLLRMSPTALAPLLRKLRGER
jgi:cytochrome b561